MEYKIGDKVKSVFGRGIVIEVHVLILYGNTYLVKHCLPDPELHGPNSDIFWFYAEDLLTESMFEEWMA